MGPSLPQSASLAGVQRDGAQLFGLPALRGRWLLLPLGIVAHLCMGTVYSWSVFRQPLEQALGLGATESMLPYTAALLCFALLMPVGGQLLPRLGPRRLMLLGGGVMALGYLVASRSQSIGQLVVGYGVIVGSGVGLAYGVPLAVAARWFPERQGLAMGLVVLGFGLSPLITAPLAYRLIASQGLAATLQLLGLAFLALMVAVALAMVLPPPGWQPPPNPQRQLPAIIVARAPQPATTAALLRSRSFCGLWLCYSLGALLGLSAIGISSPVGLEVIAIDPALAASCISLFAVFNGVSRPLFGWFSDRLRPSRVASLAYLLVLVGSLMMAGAGEGDLPTYLVAFCLFWASLGGWLAIAPAATLRCFDPERYAQTYGLVFTAYGAGALLGTLITGQLRDWLGSYSGAFLPMAVVAGVGIVLANLLLRPGRQS